MTREQFEATGWNMTYEEFLKCDCSLCNNCNCIHRDAFRRVPLIDGGLALCENLRKEE